MSFDKNWPRWLKASVYDHFNSGKGQNVLYIEGQKRKTNKEQAWLELRLDGPYSREASKDFWHIILEINIIASVSVSDDIYQIDRMVGDFAALFTNQIPIFKFGDGPDDNENIQLGCLTLDTSNTDRGIKIHHYGQIEPKTELMQSSVDARYWINLP